MLKEIKQALDNKGEGHLFQNVIGSVLREKAYGDLDPKKKVTGDQIKEALSVSDLPKTLGTDFRREGFNMPEQITDNWRRLVKTTSVKDFRATTRIGLSGFADWERVADNSKEPAGYNNDSRQENSYTVQVDTYGKLFTISREAFINDDLQLLADTAQAMRVSYDRSMEKAFVNILEGSNPAYDGIELFRAASTGVLTNIGTATALADTIAARTAVKATRALIRLQTDTKTQEKLGLNGQFFVTPSDEYADTAQEIVRSTELRQVSTAGGGTFNVLNSLIPVSIPQLAASSWYIMADPAFMHAIELTFLKGKEVPDIMITKPVMSNVLGGGDDPYSLQFDDMIFKGRQDYSFRSVFYQAVAKGQ